ncbi:hypothetical protein [Deinococcus sp.]|uniref:hypothetical protein n=1 Tax=Deinococcus sp. TaxID=47478 RepID=UPI003CC6CF1E
MKPLKRLLPALTLALGLSALAPAHAAALWLGADARTSGLEAHAGFGLLPIPFIGTLGLEAGVTTPYSVLALGEFRVGGTLQGVVIPLTSLDAFVGAGVAFRPSAESIVTSTYLEGGLRGPVLGPLGWRLSARGDSNSGFSAGVGAEIRF